MPFQVLDASGNLLTSKGGDFVSSFNASGNAPIVGAAYLKEGANIVLTQSGASVTITGNAGGGGGDPAATYLTLSLSANLTAERVLTAGSGIQFEDSGANGKLTISYNVLYGQVFG